MNPHADSLNPARHPGESMDDYKDRRKRLNTLATMAHGRVLYDSSVKNPRGKRVPVQRKDGK